MATEDKKTEKKKTTTKTTKAKRKEPARRAPKTTAKSKEEPVKEVKEPTTKKEKEDIAKGYNKFKTYEGKTYTGMKVGRSHKWYYDEGEWKEKKVTPDTWDFSFDVIKRRAGRAPEGSGVPVGTEYHWYILADQHVKKLDANNYTTEMRGLKFKLNHKRAEKDTWSTTEKTERKRLIKILETMLHELKEQPEDGQEKKEEK